MKFEKGGRLTVVWCWGRATWEASYQQLAHAKLHPSYGQLIELFSTQVILWTCDIQLDGW